MVLAPADGGIYRLVRILPALGHGAGLHCDECGRIIGEWDALFVARLGRRASLATTRFFHQSCWLLGGPERRARRQKAERHRHLREVARVSEELGLYEEARSDG